MTPRKLKMIRQSLGLSQGKLGEAIGVNWNTVCRWEVGAYPIPLWGAKFVTLLHALHKKASAHE